MVIHTPLTLAQIREIAVAYALEVESFEPLGMGSANSNYLLHTQQGKVVLSILEEQSPEEVTEMSNMLLWLEQHGFRTSRLLPQTNGAVLATVLGKNLYLKHYLPGEVQFGLTDFMLAQVGQAIGHLHKIPPPDYLSHGIYYESPTFAKAICSGLDTTYEAWLTARLADLQQKLPNDLPRGLIHGDLFEDNVLFEGEQLVAMIDFELASHYFKVFDIAMAMVGLCRSNSQLLLDKSKALVKGYQQVRVLEPGERQSLQAFTEYAATRTSNWRFWRYCYHRPIPGKWDRYKEMWRLAEAIRGISEGEFMGRVFEEM